MATCTRRLEPAPCLLLTAVALTACPEDAPSDDAATVGTTAGDETVGAETHADETAGPPLDMGNQDLEVPPESCVAPPPPPAPTPVPSFPAFDDTEVLVLDQTMDPCPETFAAFFDAVANPQPIPAVLEAVLHRPALAGGAFPVGTFPLVAFSHGNGQNGTNYDPLLHELAVAGIITASISNDGNSSGLGRAARILCVAEALLDGTTAWSGADRLDGRYAIAGHSTGGLGAFIAVSTIGETPALLAGHPLVALATIAPNAITADLELTLGAGAPPFFVLQGTGDGDTSGAAPSLYDSVRAEASGSEITSAPWKALIWAYDVEHSEYGGHSGGACSTTPKGIALGTTYFNGFLRATFYEDPEALGLFFSMDSPTPLIPPAVADPSHWQDFGGEPQVYGTSSHRVVPSMGFEARIVDGFENGDPVTSDALLPVVPSDPGMYQEGDIGSFFDARHIANAAFVGWEDGNEIRWELDFGMRVALAGSTSLTFRAGAVVDIVEPAPICTGVVGSLPTLTLLVSDGDHPELEVDLAPYGRLALPETREEVTCSGLGESDGCHAWELMQTTFRVPIGALCDPSHGVVLSRVRELGLRFEGTGDPPRVLLLDDLEIRSVPGEPEVAPDCRCPSEQG